MCCLFGMVNYSGKKNYFTDTLINNLAQEATARGIDSTGVAYNKNGKLTIYKKPLSAYEMEFKGMNDCVCITGHTRHATQGTHKRNYNNHPFMGYGDGVKFALAHNGVIWNDTTLRTAYKLPHDRIETDSYIAVQLLEHFKILDFANVGKMAELVSGSFTFTMVDNNDALWIVKGDSPLTLVHFPRRKMYVYASTEEILFAGMAHTALVDDIAYHDFEIVDIHGGDIVKIDNNGTITRATFHFDKYSAYGYDWRTYGGWDDDAPAESDFCNAWLDDIKAIARTRGFTDSDIDDLLRDGYTLDEIEDFLYY